MNVITDEPFRKVEICLNYLSGSVISDKNDKFAKYVDSDENSPKARFRKRKLYMMNKMT